MSERRVAAIDCGTNSIRLLVAADGGSGLTYLARRSEIVRLGQGIDVSGRIADAGHEVAPDGDAVVATDPSGNRMELAARG